MVMIPGLYMRKKHLLPIILIAIVLSLPLLAKGVMHLRVKQAMDDLVAASADRFEISYGAIDTELRGAASVSDIRIRPVQVQAAIEVGRVRLASDDPLAFMIPDSWRGRQQPQLPDKLQLVAEQIRIPLETAVQEALRQQAGPLQQFASQGCASFNVDPMQLRAMGFDSLTLGLDLDYRFYPADETLELGFRFDLEQIESVALSLRLNGLAPQMVELEQLAALRFAMADLRVRLEPAFGQRFLAHCAAEEGVPEEVYREKLLQGLRDNLSESGVSIGEELQGALSQYYLEWGDIRIYIKPEQPLALLQLAAVEPARLVQTLGVSLFVNERLIQDLGIRLDRDREDAPGETQPSGTARHTLVREFKPVSRESLGQYQGRVVRIHPEGQPVREGVLTTIVDGVAQVRRRTRGGSVTSHVPLNSIARVEVEQVRTVPAE